MNPTELPASVQFYDNLETISDMRVRRFPLRRIWLTLTDSGKYTGDYTHFCRLAKKEFGEEVKAHKKHNTQAKVPLQRTPENSKSPNTPAPTNDTQEDEDGPLMFMDDISTKKKS